MQSDHMGRNDTVKISCIGITVLTYSVVFRGLEVQEHVVSNKTSLDYYLCVLPSLYFSHALFLHVLDINNDS